MRIITDYSLCFWIYSFLGWICESVYCSILFRKPTNRGFLSGPVCPVYGIGALVLLLLLGGIPKNMILIFLAGAMVTTIIEYITAVLLEVVFHAKWWDYSENFLNFQGRICLLNTLMFGALSVVLIFFIQPALKEALAIPAYTIKLVVCVVIDAAFICDLTVTICSVLKLNLSLRSLNRFLQTSKEKLDGIGFYTSLNVRERMDKFFESRTDHSGQHYTVLETFRQKLKQLEKESRHSQRRIIRAFPDLRSTKYPEMLNTLKEILLGSKKSK